MGVRINVFIKFYFFCTQSIIDISNIRPGVLWERIKVSKHLKKGGLMNAKYNGAQIKYWQCGKKKKGENVSNGQSPYNAWHEMEMF